MGSFVIVFFLYFLPSFIAIYKNKDSAMKIVVFNLFLGWTIIGWIVALIWAA